MIRADMNIENNYGEMLTNVELFVYVQFLKNFDYLEHNKKLGYSVKIVIKLNG